MSVLDGVLDDSKRHRIDECEVTAVSKKTITVRITDSEIAELKEGVGRYFGVRIINNNRISTYKTDDKDDMRRAIRDMRRMPATDSMNFWKSLPHEIKKHNTIQGTFDRKLECARGSDAADIAQEMINSATDSRIDAVSGSLNIVSEIFEIGNSHGLYGKDRATYIAGIINSESKSGSLPVSGLGHGCCRTLKGFSAQKIGRDSKKMCLDSINPERCDDGRQTIIFEPYSVGEMLAFVISSNFNLKMVSVKRSCFAGRKGEQIASKSLHITDDPHAPEGIGTKPFDEEGTATKRNSLIKDGIFQNTFSDLYEGFKNGGKTTGNAARQGVSLGRSADPMPHPAPHNMRVAAGDMSLDDIIKDTKNGLLIGRLWYTYALNPIKGDFSCTARSGIRIIRNGKITGPGKQVRIIHSMPDMLQNISAIGKEERNVLQWASIPSITPALRAERVPVMAI